MLWYIILVNFASIVHAGQCCWTRWGDELTCGAYPSGVHGGLCNTDYTLKCHADKYCSGVALPPPRAVPLASEAHVYRDAVFDVVVTHDLTYGQGLSCSDQYKPLSCKPLDLKLDVYEPKQMNGGVAVPEIKPAYVLMHGGGNAFGEKGLTNIYVARWWASRGFVVFDIDYRLARDKGLLPARNRFGRRLEWSPQWASLYPATRDAKAAIRFVRANAVTYGIDVARVASSGGSAGATDMLAAGVGFEADFKHELTDAEDSTLSSTNMNYSSAVQCLVLHWPSDEGVNLIQEHYPAKGRRYRAGNPPAVSFHGNKDTTIPLKHSYNVRTAYSKTGMPFHLHVLDGCPHASWCYDNQGHCTCGSGVERSPLMEELAFPVVIESLQLNVVREVNLV